MSDPGQLSKKEEKGSIDDPWVETFDAEQEAEKANANAATKSAFKSGLGKNDDIRDMDLILDIPIKLTVELGRTKMTIKELLRVSQGSIVALDGLAGEPLDILINGYLIAQGEVVVVADKFGVRITDIITPSERMRRLSS